MRPVGYGICDLSFLACSDPAVWAAGVHKTCATYCQKFSFRTSGKPRRGISRFNWNLAWKNSHKVEEGHVVKHCNVVVITRTRQPYTLSAVQMVTSSVVYVALIR